MHIADITMFYAPASGGVRTYLDAKHRRLGNKPGIRHSLLIPGAHLSEQDGIYTVPAPALPFGKGYRFPLRLAPWRNVLQDLQPDLIEVGDPYLTAWAALDAKRQLDVPVIGFLSFGPAAVGQQSHGQLGYPPILKLMSANSMATSIGFWRRVKSWPIS